MIGRHRQSALVESLNILLNKTMTIPLDDGGASNTSHARLFLKQPVPTPLTPVRLKDAAVQRPEPRAPSPPAPAAREAALVR
jgi:hypothetical protein